MGEDFEKIILEHPHPKAKKKVFDKFFIMHRFSTGKVASAVLSFQYCSDQIFHTLPPPSIVKWSAHDVNKIMYHEKLRTFVVYNESVTLCC